MEGGEFVVSGPVVMVVGGGVDVGYQCGRRSSVGICGRDLENGHQMGGDNV